MAGSVTNREFCVARRRAELPAFVRVLKALPEGRLEHRPHPRSRSAGELAALLAYEEEALAVLVDTGRIEWQAEVAGAENAAEAAARYERAAAAVNERLEKLDEAAWEKKVTFLVAGYPPWTDSLAEFVWGFLFDAVHHRGQLSAYLRPMGGKVPEIYGPSADSGEK